MYIADYVRENLESLELDSNYTYYDSHDIWENVKAYIDFYKIYQEDLDSCDFFNNQDELRNQRKRAEILKKYLDLKAKEQSGIRFYSNGTYSKIIQNPAPSNKRVNAYFLPFANLIDRYIQQELYLLENE